MNACGSRTSSRVLVSGGRTNRGPKRPNSPRFRVWDGQTQTHRGRWARMASLTSLGINPIPGMGWFLAVTRTGFTNAAVELVAELSSATLVVWRNGSGQLVERLFGGLFTALDKHSEEAAEGSLSLRRGCWCGRSLCRELDDCGKAVIFLFIFIGASSTRSEEAALGGRL